MPHSFQRSQHGVEKSLSADCDDVEVSNAWAVTSIQNHGAAAFANRVVQPGLEASDNHRPETVGTAATGLSIDGLLVIQRLLNTVVADRCRAVGRSIRLSTSLRTYETAHTQFIRYRRRTNSTAR
ncbi:MAG: hypothetical protein J07HN4v3_02917 [Halonotius sp. J07HN4]|nr:MAG: hypothetical protein J07HN4v3_02917 [Halonotius sp. J07HN4]